MQRVIVGTAGHIDHGKTRLVEAITGIDCDRWAEERERGITIDLGFAHLSRDDLQIGFIDVPGHERFLHNALAGLGGIRILLLVVAADEGIKPQTLEHLEICSLLGIPKAIVALTKTDVVSSDLVELAQLEVEDVLSSSPWPDARILAVSSITGEGVPELVELITSAAEALPEDDEPTGPARLPIDRAFQLKGLGSIVTGTLVSGTIGIGDTLRVVPGEGRGKVRSVQIHGEERARALAGERTALQLAGVPVEEVARGLQLVSPGVFKPSTSLLVALDLLPSSPVGLSGSTPIRMHLYSREVVGRIRPLDVGAAGELEPGGSAVAEIRLASPMLATRGDRFVIRRPSPPSTLGGGTVLDPWWQRRRGKPLASAIEALADSLEAAVEVWASETGLDALTADDLAGRLGCGRSEAERVLAGLTSDQRLLAVESGRDRPTRWIRPCRFKTLTDEAHSMLARYLERERLATGMPKAEAVRRLMPRVAPELARIYLEWLESQGTLEVRGDVITLPGREASLTREETGLASRLAHVYDEAALMPPSPAEAAIATGSKPQIVDGVIHYLIQQSTLARLAGGLVISAAALEALREDLLASAMDDFTVAQFKERFGISRKWAIPILEHLDARRITYRVGDVRKIAQTRDTGA